MTSLATYIDHTLLSPIATETDIRKICEEAWVHQFKAVCVAPSYVPYIVEMLEFCPIKIEVITVVGFPFGFNTTSTKIFEAEQALSSGATEIEAVMNFSQFKSMAYLSVREELRQLSEVTRRANALLTVIIEPAFLDSFDLYTVTEICTEANVDFVKITSEHDDPELLRKLRSLLPSNIKIKVSGQIQTIEEARKVIEAGAERISTSLGVTIINQG
jgi:deoxyribose-phosphate aldolase